MFDFDKTVILGSDHNGVALKAEVKRFLKENGYHCVDVGPYTSDKVDYVDFASTVGKIVDTQDARWGVLICGTGVGMSMVANRYPGVRAALVHSLEVAHKTREHNDANVICLGAWINPTEENLKIVEGFFSEPFGEGRHVKRVEKTKRHDKDKIVFTNGIFDLLHAGHIDLLKFSKSLGGKLIVGMNSDRSTKILKGPDRPIISEENRKKTLESLGMIDEVIIFDETSPFELMNKIGPDIIVKGGEWTAEEVRQRDKIPAEIEVKVFPLVMDPALTNTKYSTTEIIKKIKGS